HVLYGSTNAKSFTFDATYRSADVRKELEENARKRFAGTFRREPTPDELMKEIQQHHNMLHKGYTAILFLGPPTAGQKANVSSIPSEYYSVLYDVQQSVISRENQIADTMRDGSYLRPNPFFVNPPILEAKVAGADSIVRAVLQEVRDDGAV